MSNKFFEKIPVDSLFDECYCFDCMLCEKCCREKKPKKETRELVTDQLCGNILTNCNGMETVLWETSLVSAFGTATLFLSGGCSNMDVFINDVFSFSLQKGQAHSTTVKGLKKLAVSCSNGSSSCEGKYCINLHYDRPSFP
ncbi:S-Ena type endospore appendage [Guptibacillus algicola]|uniref:S-Ena type endospore appendage n=1 Tax=Guptibacillus algicola TaxID=225844 RepID=UPI001CD35B22|nr:S-Ena type endospore appendage [Alkalihalobacillus algicola]MCA0986510.1 hypothetical protein [Alkalihalobacillus algicola]